MSSQSQEVQTSWNSTIHNIIAFPPKFVIASTLILVNIFQNMAQTRNLQKAIKNINEGFNVNKQAKQQLFAYLSQFKSVNTFLYPIMLKEYSKQNQNQQYKIGLLINGDAKWQQIVMKIKDHIKISSQTALSFFCEKHIISQGNIKNLHNRFKHEDGVMYMQYTRMQSYG